MRKRWKNWGLFILAALLSVFAVPLTAFAQKGEERAAVYVQVPQDWESPCIWAWDEEGNNAFAAWPGRILACGPGPHRTAPMCLRHGPGKHWNKRKADGTKRSFLYG